MLSFDTAGTTLLASSVRGVQWLVALEFGTGTVRYTTHAVDITSGGYTWAGYGGLVSVDTVREAEDGAAPDVVLGLSIVSVSMLAAATGSVANYRNKPASLYLQGIGETYQPVGAPVLRWKGYMNKVRIKRQTSKDGSSMGTIEMVCSKAGANRSRAASGLRLSHQQQVQRFPGDLGLEYVQKLLEQPAQWLSKRFQER